MSKLPLVVILGPTASGKSALAIRLAKELDGEIISGDSMQVYRGMDIGTAKVTVEEMEGVPHHLIDILDPQEPFSVAQFQQRVEALIAEIANRGKLPFLVGGTGLYIRSVIDPYHFAEEGRDLQLRQALQEEGAALGFEVLLERLRAVDPLTANRLHVNDQRRIIRALEVYQTTGRPPSEYHEATYGDPKYQLAYIGLTLEREKLYERINQRVDLMMQGGLVVEVQRLMAEGVAPDYTSMQAIGYKEIVDYLQGQTSLEEAVNQLKQNTRRFAKRQLTWFRRDPRITWYRVDSYPTPDALAQEVMAYICRTIQIGVE